MAQTASPLDQPKVAAYIKSALKGDRKPSEIVHGLQVSYGVTTTKDSIRRFRDRHGVTGSVTKVKAAPKAKRVVKTQPKDTASTVGDRGTRPSFSYSIIKQDGEECITVFAAGKKPLVADSTHPNYTKIVELAKGGDDAVLELFDIEQKLSTEFKRLSDRVMVRNGRIYFDGDEIHNALTEHIVRFLEQGNDNYQPLVAFLEKVYSNPIEHSREQLYRWLASHEFSITDEGDIIAYKGVFKESDIPLDHTYRSSSKGHAIVDGVEVNGYVPQSADSIVEMPRGEVVHDPSASCSTGLHIGTFPYAGHFGNTRVEVHVNPRDVVSVPNGEAEKARTCRYVVVDEVTEPYTSAVVITKATSEKPRF